MSQKYIVGLKQIIISACESIFVNHYILIHGNAVIPSCIYKQNFWYSICQLVNDDWVTNGTTLLEDIVSVWNAFRPGNPSILYPKKLVKEASQCLAQACVEVSTAYLNNTVEMFETRLLSYLNYLVQNTIMVDTNNNFTIHFIKLHFINL